MGQNRDGFLHPAGALTAREKNGLSAAPARSAEPLYPSNDPGEGRVPADWKSAASRPACSGHRPPLTPPRAMKKPTVSIVLGGGHSIGIPLAVAAKKSFIAKSASMTVHPVRTTGLTLGVPQTFEYFQRMQDRITTFVAENSNITKDRYNQLVLNTGELVMDIGTILEGEEAVEEGLIDEVGTDSDAIDALYDLIKESKESKPKSAKSRSKKQEK